MDIERALKRRAAMLTRISRELKFGITLPEDLAQARQHGPRNCQESAYGEHGEPNWRGRCPYCDKFLRRRSRLNTKSIDVFKYPKGSQTRNRLENLRTFGEDSDDFPI